MDCKLFYEQRMNRLSSAFEVLNRIEIYPELWVDEESLEDDEFRSYVNAVKKDCNILNIPVMKHSNAVAYSSPFIMNNYRQRDMKKVYDMSFSNEYNMDGFYNKAIARGILELIKSENVSKNMPIVVFGKSYNVGAPIIVSLIKNGYMVKVLDSKSTKQEVQHCLDTCYWFILCANKPIINASQFLKGSYVLDCGYSIVDGTVYGNVIYDIPKDSLNTRDRNITISDIHNGVNLLTRIGLLYNLLDFYLGVGI